MTDLTISMPMYHTPAEVVQRAVDSILAQTYEDFRLIITNDGGNHGWESLEDYDDERIVRFDLPQNKGRYFVDAVTLAACDTKWWSPHDSDDESVPDRFEIMTEAIGEREVAYSDSLVMKRDGKSSYNKAHKPKTKPIGLGNTAKYPSGIYRADALRRIGGPHPESRGSYDTALMCLTFIAYKPVLVHKPLYVVHKRAGSLSTGKKTGLGTDWRKAQRRKRKRLFNKVARKPVDQWVRLLTPRATVATELQGHVERLRSIL